MTKTRVLIFGGRSSKRLTQKICQHLKLKPGDCEAFKFSEGNTFVRINENVRGQDVFLVQSIVFPPNDSFVELLFWIDALKRASANSVTVVIPYFSYAKADKKDEPRVSIRARVCADAIETAGADRIVTLDLHSPQIQGFFRVPVDVLYALKPFCDHLETLKELKDLVVVSPDAGFAKQARKFAAMLDAPLAIADKIRKAHDDRAEIKMIMGRVKGKTALVVDDFTLSATTIAETARKLKAKGAKSVYAAVTHGVFVRGSMETIQASPIRRLFVSDSIETQPVRFSDKIEIVSVAPLFGEAIKRIHNNESISVLFQESMSPIERK